MNKFAEAYPGTESKGKHRYAVVYCGHSAYGAKRSCFVWAAWKRYPKLFHDL